MDDFEFRKRNETADPSWLGNAVKIGKKILRYGPLSGRLYQGTEFCNVSDGEPAALFSFVPVCSIPAGDSTSTRPALMRLRPRLKLQPIYNILGENTAPNPNAQLISRPVGMINDVMRAAVFSEIQQQVTEQGFEMGVTISPPSSFV